MIISIMIKHKYVKNWSAIAYAYRMKKGDRCIICNCKGSRLNPNVVDHRDGNKFNNDESNFDIYCPKHHLIKGIDSGEISPKLFDRLKNSIKKGILK